MADETSFLTPLLRELTFGIDAWKKPVKVVATGNITQSGLQTVDGVALAAGDEVLCVGQSSAAQNGVFVAATGAWPRRFDASNSERLFEGVRVPVTRGTHAGEVYRLVTTGKISVGITAQTWQLDAQGGGGDVSDVVGSGQIEVAEADGVFTVSAPLLDNASAGNDPDALVIRGPGGEIHSDRLVVGGGDAATTGDVSLPSNATIYGRVSTGGGQDARLIGLSGTSLRVGDQRSTPRIVAPASGDIEFASGASDAVFARLRSTTACAQAGDFRFDATTGRMYHYVQGVGEQTADTEHWEMAFGNVSAQWGGSTRYLHPGFSSAGTTAIAGLPVSNAGTATTISVYCATPGTGTGTYTFTMSKVNTSTGALTTTSLAVSIAVTARYATASGSVAISAGEVVAVQYDVTGSVTGAMANVMVNIGVSA